MWKETTEHERNLRIFKEELEDFLPSKILDFHVHIFPRHTIPSGHEKFSCAGHKITQYTFEELKEDIIDIYPKRDCYAVCFGMPDRKYDAHNNNEYVAKHCDHKQFFTLRLLRPEDDPEIVTKEIKEKNFLGFKGCYCSFFGGGPDALDRDEVRIYY